MWGFGSFLAPFMGSIKVLLISGVALAGVFQLNSIRNDAAKSAALEYEVREVARVAEGNRDRTEKAKEAERKAKEKEIQASEKLRLAEKTYEAEIEKYKGEGVGICDLRCVLPSASD